MIVDVPNVGTLVGRGICAAVAVDAALVCAGIFLRPDSISGGGGVLSLLGPAVILGLYFVVGRRAGRAAAPHAETVQRMAAGFGLAAGILFTSEILLEYAILPDTRTNIRLGWIEYGSVFLLLAFAGLATARNTGSVRAGVRGASWSAMIASPIWLAALLLTTYVFWGTAHQEQVFRAEGDYEDFARSGVPDFAAFIPQDLRGAYFFHLLLTPALAALVGAAAGSLERLLYTGRDPGVPTGNPG